jgi:hypothetical protein
MNHDVRWNPYTNNITVLDNGEDPTGNGTLGVEVNPDTDAVVWQWPTSRNPNFYSRRQSGFHALPNGNYVIVPRTGGRVVEVTNAGEVAWEFKNPIGQAEPKCYVIGLNDFSWGFHKALRYPADHPALVGRDLSKAVPFKEGCQEVWKWTEPPVTKPTVTINGGSFRTGDPLTIEVVLNGPGPYDVYAGMSLGTTRYYAFDTNMCFTDANHVYPLRKEFTPSGSTIKVFQFTVPPLAGTITAGVFVDVRNPGYDTALASATNTVTLNPY